MNSTERKNQRGFTLIELLIVVAIIAILAAIAVPNFLEAQTRAKVARVLNDQRTMATAMEAYFIDNGQYIKDSDSSLDLAELGQDAATPFTAAYGGAANGALSLTTPIAYLTSLLEDPFGGKVVVAGGGAIGYRVGSGSWSYDIPSPSTGDSQNSDLVFDQVGAVPAYVIISVGPDQVRNRIGYKNFPFMSDTDPNESFPPSMDLNPSKGAPMNYVDYDPSNGTVSIGDIYRIGGSDRQGRYMRNGEVVGRQATPPGTTDVF
jgi:prepilin-type N-terminal cleavage/methylation domain-containing protein